MRKYKGEKYGRLLEKYNDFAERELEKSSKFQEKTKSGIGDCLGNTLVALMNEEILDEEFHEIHDIIEDIIKKLDSLDIEIEGLKEVSEKSIGTLMGENHLGKVNHFKEFFDERDSLEGND